MRTLPKYFSHFLQTFRFVYSYRRTERFRNVRKYHDNIVSTESHAFHLHSYLMLINTILGSDYSYVHSTTISDTVLGALMLMSIWFQILLAKSHGLWPPQGSWTLITWVIYHHDHTQDTFSHILQICPPN